jgi:hypothetical protein
MERRFPPLWAIEELDAMTANQPMTAEATLKRSAKAAYELDSFKPQPHARQGGSAYRNVDS